MAEQRAAEAILQIQQLEQAVADQALELAQVRAEYKQALDEFERAKQRMAREGQREVERHKERILRSFVEVADDLDRAIDAGKAVHDTVAVIQGVQLVRERFMATMSLFGVSPMDTKGMQFDPSMHDAVSFVRVDDPAQHKVVVDVLKRGYLFGERLFRVASVAVGNYDEQSSEGVSHLSEDTNKTQRE